MKGKSRSNALVGVGVILFLGFALLCADLCNAQTNPQGPPYDKELVVITPSFTTDNALPNLEQGVGLSIWGGLYEYLINRDKDTWAKIPGVAERWEATPDYRQWTFHLHKGIQFHDKWGELTAEDVKFSMEMARQKGSVNARAAQWRKTVENIVIKDRYTITFNLKRPDWQFADDLSRYIPALPIVCKKYVLEVGEKKANEHPIGTGPYKFVERRRGDYLKFEALPHHWRKTPDFKYLTVRNVPEVSTRLAMLRSGKADIAPIPTDMVNEVRKAGLRTVVNEGANTYWLAFGSLPLPTNPNFDPSLPWWADPADKPAWERAFKVRKALALAINKKEIMDALFHGTATPLGVACFGWPRQAGGYEDPSRWPPYPYDPEQAKRLLVEAGYPKGFEVTMILMRQTGRDEARTLAEAVAIYWEKIGLKVNRRPLDYALLRPLMTGRKLKNPYVMGARWYVEPIVAAWRRSSSENNYLTGAEYAPMEKLSIKGSKEVDSGKRHQMARQWAQIMYENYFTIPLVGTNAVFAISNRIGEWPVVLGAGYEVQEVEYITLKRGK